MCAIAVIGVAAVGGLGLCVGDPLKLAPAIENPTFLFGTLGASVSLAVLMHLVFEHIENGIMFVAEKFEKGAAKRKQVKKK